MSKNRESTLARRNKIIDKLSEAGEVFVDQLSKEFLVSEVTIRNDLDQLEKKRMLVRARGGAMKIEGRMGVDYGINEKDRIHIVEKRKIGKFAASLVEDGEIIIIDSGTTTVEFTKNIDHHENLTVITNALNIALVLAHKTNINLIIPGGFMRKNSQSLVGPMAEKSISNFNVDKLFLGVDGIDVNNGLYTPNLEEAHLNELMIRVSKEVIVLMDSSKFDKRSFAHICGMEKVHRIVTDDGISKENYDRLIELGIEVSII